MDVILGFDAGTHGVRALAYGSGERGILASAGRDYARRCAPGVQEMSPAVLEEAFRATLGDILALLPEGTRVEALGITHQRGTVIPADSRGRPLGPALCDSDSRAASGEELRALGLEPLDYYRRTGCPFVSFNGMAKILWARFHDPELYRRAAVWLSPQDYLLSLLTGRITVTAGSSARNGCLAAGSQRLDRGLFPGEAFLEWDCVPVGRSCGEAGESWAREFPALAGARTVAVPGDQPAAVIGSGAVNGDLAMNLGTSFVASLACAAPAFDSEGLATVEVLPENGFAVEFGTGAGGQFTDWLAGMLLDGVAADDSFWASLDARAGEAPPGAGGLRVTPLLWQVTSPGVVGGVRNLGLSHNRSHLIRAAYEGLSCEAKLSIRRVELCAGRTPDTLRVFGGMSANPVFLGILASVTGKTVLAAAEKQSSALGAALTAALACGHFSSLAEASAAAGTGRQYFPREEETYGEQFFKDYCAGR